MDREQGEFADDDRHEALIVAVLRRGARHGRAACDGFDC